MCAGGLRCPAMREKKALQETILRGETENESSSTAPVAACNTRFQRLWQTTSAKQHMSQLRRKLRSWVFPQTSFRWSSRSHIRNSWFLVVEVWAEAVGPRETRPAASTARAVKAPEAIKLRLDASTTSTVLSAASGCSTAGHGRNSSCFGYPRTDRELPPVCSCFPLKPSDGRWAATSASLSVRLLLQALAELPAPHPSLLCSAVWLPAAPGPQHVFSFSLDGDVRGRGGKGKSCPRRRVGKNSTSICVSPGLRVPGCRYANT